MAATSGSGPTIGTRHLLLDVLHEGTVSNPTGPTAGNGSVMPDGNQYHTLRGGSFAQDPSDAAIANRDPAFYRQPLNNTYASVGFRIVLTATSPVQPGSADGLDQQFEVQRGGVGRQRQRLFLRSGRQHDQQVVHRRAVLGLPNRLRRGRRADLRPRGNLVACQDTRADRGDHAQGTTTVLASQYNDKRFNDPYDLWIDP